MGEETLGKIMLALFALAAFSALALFLITKSAPSSALQRDPGQHPIAIRQ